MQRVWIAALLAAPAVAQVTTDVILSDSERLDRAEESVGAMSKSLKEVERILEEARRDKDVLKLTCVNEKLSQLRGLHRVSQQAQGLLQEAVTRRDRDDAEHQSLKITIARERVEQLRVEAEQCIGQLAFVIDEKTMVEVLQPTGLPPGDPTDVIAPGPAVVRPPPASPEKP